MTEDFSYNVAWELTELAARREWERIQNTGITSNSIPTFENWYSTDNVFSEGKEFLKKYWIPYERKVKDQKQKKTWIPIDNL